jgi:hypothetical protein
VSYTPTLAQLPVVVLNKDTFSCFLGLYSRSQLQLTKNFCLPESLSLGLHGNVLASQNGWVAESQQLDKVGFAQTSRFTEIIVLIRDTCVNNHPKGQKSRKIRPGMPWGHMSTVSKHIAIRAGLGLLGCLASSLALA